MRLVCNDKSSSFRKLFARDKSVAVHKRNIQVLLTRKRGCTRTITEIFKFKDYSHDLKKNNCIEKRIIKSCEYGSGIVSNLRAKLWDILPENIKKAESLQGF